MRLRSIGGRGGPFSDVLLGEVNIEDISRFDAHRLSEEVYHSMYRDPELDRRYRGRSMTPVILVVHHQSRGYGAGMTATSMLDSSFDDLRFRYDQLIRENRLLKTQIEQLSNPYVTPKETNQNLLLL